MLSLPRMTRRRRIGTATFLTALALCPIDGPAAASDPAFQQSVEEIVRQYLLAHPEIVEESLRTLESRRAAEERTRVRSVIIERRAELLHDSASPVSGNPTGTVTLVEFFDYRCGFCKRVAGAVTRLQQEDPGIRVVYKDFPILGESSIFAARAALASNVQGKHTLFHEALLAADTDLTQDVVFRIAAQVGLDVMRLQTDMADPAVQAAIDRNHKLAADLGIAGTPGFIAGQELVPGAMELEALKDFVARARSAE